MRRPYLWGALAGGLAAWLLGLGRRGGNTVEAAPKIPRQLRKSARLKLPGERREIGGS